MKQIFEDCKRVEIEDDGNRAFKTINIIRKHGISVKIDISYARLKGKWISCDDNDLIDFKKCSNCGECAEWLDGGSQFLSNFCPNCGADMRGEKE